MWSEADLVERLASLPIFAGLSGAGLGALVRNGAVRSFRAGEIVFRQGEYGFEFYVVLSGAVSAIGTVPGSGDREYAVVAEDGFFGEMGPMVGRPRIATIEAVGDTVLLEIREDDFHDLIRSVPSFKAHMDESYFSRALITCLGSVPLFESLSQAQLGAVVASASLDRYEAGDVVIRQGSAPDAFYLVRRGSLKVTQEVGGETKLLSYVTDNGWFGEMAFLEGGKRTSTVTALDSVELVVIPAGLFLQLVDDSTFIRGQIRQVADQRRGQIGRPERGDLALLLDRGMIQFDEVLAIDLNLCLRCGNCETACARTHNGTARVSRRGLRVGDTLIPSSCNMCPDPACMKACRFGVITRERDGTIAFRDHCNGCQRCVTACPYGVIGIAERSVVRSPVARWWRRLTGSAEEERGRIAVKCDLCQGLPTMGCVVECPTGAMRRVEPKTLLDP